MTIVEWFAISGLILVAWGVWGLWHDIVNESCGDDNEHFNDWVDGHERRMGDALTDEQKAHLAELRARWPRKP